MGIMVSGVLVALLLHGLSANQDLKDLSNPTAREINIHMNMLRFVAPKKRGFPLQTPWLVKLTHEEYDDLEENLVSSNDTKSNCHV